MHTILIIEDDTGLRSSLMQILEFENYAPLGAENGMVGLQMIRQHSPGLIFCDVDMPVMNGIEVLRTVKADPELAKIPFVVMSGRSDLPTQQTISDLGAEKYLLKTLLVTDFLATIFHFLSENDFNLDQILVELPVPELPMLLDAPKRNARMRRIDTKYLKRTHHLRRHIMMPSDRSAQITKILKAISEGNMDKINAELEIYIADLETEKSNRPARITAILTMISTQYPADMGVSLEEYIAQLEAGQQVIWSEDHQTPSSDPQRPLIWSHQRKVQRAQHRSERAKRKQNSY